MLISCKDVKKTKMEPLESDGVSAESEATTPHLGKRILEQECYMCHNPKASRTEMIAPPMQAIKLHYIDSNTTKEEFTEALLNWVNNPETESKMPDAHKNFGVMPYMPTPGDAIKMVAEYLYDNEIERPDWFDGHFQKSHQRGMEKCNCMFFEEAEAEYLEIGSGYVKEAQDQLKKNLIKAISEKGTAAAIDFCNIEAIRITDSVSVMNNAIIKRVSDKPRNPNNLANADELKYIISSKKDLVSGKELKPELLIENGGVTYYSPIMTNALCLQCHGKTNQQISVETLSILKQLYPKDQAIEYDVNELRGIWSVQFDVKD